MRDVGFWQGISDVVHGRGQLRLIVQPLIATIFGVRLGIADAKAGRAPFLWRLFISDGHKAKLAKDALREVLIPFCVAVVLDGILQYLTLQRVRPLAAIVVATVLIFIPFMITRALTNRIYRRTHRSTQTAA